MVEVKPLGWCYACLEAQTPCLVGPGRGEKCVACHARDLGLPAGTPLDDVLRELARAALPARTGLVRPARAGA